MFKRLKEAFSNPIMECVLLFHNTSIKLFTYFNQLLQRSEPTIRILEESMITLAKKIANRIVKPDIIRDTAITDLNLEDEEIFKPNNSIFLGGMVKFTLNKLLNEGDISPAAHRKFFVAAHHYFKSSLDYILRKFPLNDEVITNAVWINVPERIRVQWENVEYFHNRCQPVFKEISADSLYEEFCDYHFFQLQKQC